METAAAAPQNTWSRLLHWIGSHADIASAVTLSIAGLLTSWSGYQAALWDGDQAAAYSQAGAIRTEASRREIQAGQFEGADVLMFTQWLDAEARGEARLAGFYEQRFRPEYRIAHAAWRAHHPLTNPAAPPTPFVMPEYRLVARAEGAAMEAAPPRCSRRASAPTTSATPSSAPPSSSPAPSSSAASARPSASRASIWSC
jgi:hypothetical protein